MRHLLSISLVALALTLAGCATEPIPKDYTGPTANLQDTGVSEDGSKAQMFAAVELDGKPIMNAFWESTRASEGHGDRLTTVYTGRAIMAKPMKVKLRGSHITGAPIHAIASQMAGTFFSVEGVVDFSPVAGHSYEVRGELKKAKSSVWIEDTAAAGKPVTQVVSN